MKAFDMSYNLLDEMYQDEYFPDFLVDKVRQNCKKSSVCWRAVKPIQKSFRKNLTR